MPIPSPESKKNIYSGKRVLVTGANGYIGQLLSNHLAAAGCSLTTLARSPSTSAGKISGVREVVGDITDPSTWDSALAEDIEVVFHLAAQTSAYKAAQDPLRDYAVNAGAVAVLADRASSMAHMTHIVLASSATVYGLPTSLPVGQKTPDGPTTVYDVHKQAAENYLRVAGHRGDITWTSLRLANVYGPGRASSASDRGVLNKIVARALNGDGISVYGSGAPIRDYVFVDDVVAAFAAAGCRPLETNMQVYPIGTGRGTSLLEAFTIAVEAAASSTGIRVSICQVEAPDSLLKIEYRDFIADIDAFNQATGWVPITSLENGVMKTVHSLVEQ